MNIDAPTLLLGYTSPAILIPLLTLILLVSAFKVWRHLGTFVFTQPRPIGDIATSRVSTPRRHSSKLR